MARIKIDLPQHFNFTTNIDVRVTDLNYGNHLGNNALLGLIHEARVRFLRHYNCNDEREVFGVGLIMSDTAIEYKAEGFLGDVLTVKVAVGDFSRVGFDFYYQFTKADGTVLANAKTGMVCFDYTTRKVAACPEALLASWRHA